MIQYGDITKLSGYDLDPVDLIVGGSPCQDLSVAGKRAGLDGERSGLFMEMIRLIREMREKTNGICPRFALWENVPGAFSSNKGKDFSVVLGEFSRVAEPDAPDVPVPEEGWPKSGVLLGANWSIAWRTHDAQFWGVPQRRRRISLIVYFGGESAPEILFERKSVPGDTEQSETQRKDPTGTAENSFGKASEPIMIEMTSTKNTICQSGTSPTLTARMGTGGNQVNAVLENIAVYDPSVHHGYRQFDDVSETVRTRYGTGGNNQRLVVATMQGLGDYIESDVASSCKQRDYKDATDLVCRIQTEPDCSSVDCRNMNENRDINGTLQAKTNGGWNCNSMNVVRDLNNVRRLTPLECERLQGYPDGWTDIPGASDSKRYKALGNSIALPFWEHLAKRFVEIGDVKSIGSLFDGIGGFPLCFKRAGAETKWTSEIEPFPEQVVKYHLDKGEL